MARGEMCQHLFRYCPMAEAVLFGLDWGLPMNDFHFDSHMELIFYSFKTFLMITVARA